MVCCEVWSSKFAKKCSHRKKPESCRNIRRHRIGSSFYVKFPGKYTPREVLKATVMPKLRRKGTFYYYRCYNPKCRNLSTSITSSIFGCFEKFLDRPSSNPQTNADPVSKQARPRGKYIKSWFFSMWFSYDFGTGTVAVKSLLWLGIPRDSQILAPVYSLF